MKVGIYSGTFDPIHKGHIAFALAAIEKCGLDEVLLVVEPRPRRKSSVTPYRHRQAMARRASEAFDKITADRLSPSELGLTHTARRTFDVLDAHLPSVARPVLLMGGEVFQNLHHWIELDELLGRADFAIALRSGQKAEAANPALDNLTAIYIESPLPHVASSQIREELAAGGLALDLNSSVQRYIREHGLYGHEPSQA